MKGDGLCIQHDNADGRLIRSMEYWLRWNELAGARAHYRIQLETVRFFALYLRCSTRSNPCVVHVALEETRGREAAPLTDLLSKS